MKRLIIFLTIMVLVTNWIEAQQIKRSTLTSVGTLKAIPTFRVSWTAGSCPGCNVLHPTSPTGAGYVRQGFQQPPFNGNSAGCPSITPFFNILPFPSATCGTKFDLEYAGVIVPNIVVEWNFGEGATPQTSNQLNPTGIFYATSGVKIVTLKVSSGNCTDTRAKTINVAPNQIGFSSMATVTDVKCRNDKTGAIALTPIGGSTGRTYRWSNGAVTQNLTNVAAGRYTVTTTDGAGCTAILDTVIKQPATAISFTSTTTQETCKDYADGAIELTVSGGTPPLKTNWANGSTTPIISSLVAGAYKVTILDSNNCKIDTSFFVARRCRDTTKKFTIYDVITPNGDGKNDKWVIANIEKYPDNELFIYNRWGQLVYSTKKYLNDWAGTNQDKKELPTAAYYYVIRLNDGNNTVWEGSVTILR